MSRSIESARGSTDIVAWSSTFIFRPRYVFLSTAKSAASSYGRMIAPFGIWFATTSSNGSPDVMGAADCDAVRLTEVNVDLGVTMAVLIMALILMAGCSATDANYDSRPFFQSQPTVELHGRKTLLDHLVELDPGRVHIKLAANYAEEPPERIAVLPFVDHGSAQFRVDKIALTHRDEQQKEKWAWIYANRLRRSFAGQIAEREFTIVPIPAIDTALQDHGIDNWRKLMAVSPQQLGQWLDADTVVYGEVLHYDAYYALLVAAWEVGVKVQLVSTYDGHQILEASDNRYSVDLCPSFDPLDIGLNSALSLLELRDVTLARAEDEVSREIVLRVPVSDKALAHLQMAVRTHEDGQYVEASGPQTGYIIPVRTIETPDGPLNRNSLLESAESLAQ